MNSTLGSVVPLAMFLFYDLTKDVEIKEQTTFILHATSSEAKNQNINSNFPQAENFKSLTKKAEFLETRMGRAVVMMSLSLIK